MEMRRSRALLAFLLALIPAPAIAAASPATVAAAPDAGRESADAQLRALYEAYWEWENAERGNVPDGEGGYTSGDRLARVDSAAQARRQAYLRETLAKLGRIDGDALSEDEKINAAVLATLLENDLIDGRFREWEMPFNSDSSFWTYLNERRPFLTAREYRRYIARMRDIPRYFDEHVANMRAGLERGFSVPRVTIEGRDQSIASFVTDRPEENAFFSAFRDMPRYIPAAEQAALRAEAEKAISDQVVPAYRKLLAFYREEYLPRTRTSISAQDLPDGDAYYRAQIGKYTTLDLSPEEVHRIGLSEVERIDAEMKAIMRETGFAGSFPEFLHFLRTDPQFYARTPEELLMFSAWVAKRVDGRIGDTIGLLPRGRFTIIPVPEALAPFYTAGRGGLGSCQMNTHNLPSRPLYAIPALTLHECAPGHSFQAALAEERDSGPGFRRNTYFSGFGEGWGLYTEWLGIDMGIYRTPYEHFGRLSYEMWRAARLVIDTGIHLHGWSRQQAIDYLAGHTALSQHEVETEVDRYISWPGQALAYKLGEMTIRRLRTEAESELGPKFDQRRFHDVILALGSVPLPVLEARIATFIAEERERPEPAPAG